LRGSGPVFGPRIGLAVALDAAQPARGAGAFLAVLDGGAFGRVALRSRGAAPDLAVVGHRERAALPRGHAEDDLAVFRGAALERGFVGPRLRGLVPARAVAPARAVMRE